MIQLLSKQYFSLGVEERERRHFVCSESDSFQVTEATPEHKIDHYYLSMLEMELTAVVSSANLRSCTDDGGRLAKGVACNPDVFCCLR